MSVLDRVRADLPLEVAGATLGSAWLNLHGPGFSAEWFLNVMSPWSLEWRFEVLLTEADEDVGPHTGNLPVDPLTGKPPQPKPTPHGWTQVTRNLTALPVVGAVTKWILQCR
jgi:hypothetical protein